MAIKSFKKGPEQKPAKGTPAKAPAKPAAKAAGSAKKAPPAAPKKETKALPARRTEKQEAAEISKATGRSALPSTQVAMGNQDDVSGEVNSSDIKLPYLALVQGVGDLSAIFTPGQLVLAGEVELTAAPEKEKPGDPVNVVIVWARKQLIEKLPYQSEEMPRIFNTAAEAQEAGLTTEWVDNEPPQAGPMLTCLVLVEETEKAAEMESPYFTLEYDGKKFAPCMWRIKSTAYNRAGKAILTAKALAKSEPLFSRQFALSAKREKVGQNWVFTPNIRATGKHDPDFVQFVRENQGAQ